MTFTKRKTESAVIVTLKELALAYRKAKVDLFYSSRACRGDLCEFERDLNKNLKAIQRDLAAGKYPAVPEDTWTLVPKHLDLGKPEYELIRSDPAHHWKSFVGKAHGGEKPKAEFRLMENLPIAFHVFATLWINRVGHKFDAKLSSAARGNRLRRRRDGTLNELSLGSNQPYHHAYRRWREDGLTAARAGLEAGKSIVVVSADVASFYHKLDPSFMLNKDFMEKILKVKLDASEARLHQLFIDSLVAWAAQTPLGNGLPVGLIASSLIANLALFELDQLVDRQIAPLYYGRYVDDILLVMEDGVGFHSKSEVWRWLCARSGGTLKINDEKDKSGETKTFLRYSQSYLTNSTIRFSNTKNQVFLLRGDSGKAMLTSIEREIRERSSEWRAAPRMPAGSSEIGAGILMAIQPNGEGADGFHKLNKLSVRRAAFALRIRDVEAYHRALPPDVWADKRHAFIDAFTDHIVVLPAFFDFFAYLTRVVQLATACADFAQLARLLTALDVLFTEVQSCTLSIKATTGSSDSSEPEIIAKFRRELHLRIEEAIGVAFPKELSAAEKRAWLRMRQSIHEKSSEDRKKKSPSNVVGLYKDFQLTDHHEDGSRFAGDTFIRDLGYRPLKQLLLPSELIGCIDLPASRDDLNKTADDDKAVAPCDAIKAGAKAVWHPDGVEETTFLPLGLSYPTRPPTPAEFYLLHRDPFSDAGRARIKAGLLAMRGFPAADPLPGRITAGPKQPIEIPLSSQDAQSVRIAVASWSTDRASWTAALTKQTDPDRNRFDRLNRMINAVLNCEEAPDYFILPELSVPPRWFSLVATKLSRKGISLICGVEYQHAGAGRVRNEVWAALVSDVFGFSTTVIYRQEKQRAALHEEEKLWRIAGCRFAQPTPPMAWQQPPIIAHGDFHFALLVCSELSNITYRTALRGQIDALFIPEWNKDINTFNPLVESAALDVHCFVVQCNHREYGDSRIRVPHKTPHKRDCVQVRGGEEDYFVIGKIDVAALRRCQSHHRSPSEPFKPVPDGFEMSPRRRVLPE